MKNRVLLVEDSITFARMIVDRVERELAVGVSWFATFDDTNKELASRADQYFIALLDYNLPDSSKGEVIDLCISYGIPSVVVTADLKDDIQEFVWTKNVVDYVLKEGVHTIDYLMSLVLRIRTNPSIGILVVDDSPTARRHLRDILSIHCYAIIEASTGAEALEALDRSPEIKLAVIDYQLPDMDGFYLTSEIRKKKPLDSLAIIGMSAEGSHKFLIKYMKYGANDFISKPFLREQLFCRVTQNVSIIEQFETIRAISFTDFLTGARNRRYFFEFAPFLLKNAGRDHAHPVVAMIDIDRFKSINDTYGHKAGDAVLKTVSAAIRASFRETDIVARIGGEEFCVFAGNMAAEMAFPLFEQLREKIRREVTSIDGKDISVTVSIGLCSGARESLDEMLRIADASLYSAKESGRNRTILS